MRLRGQVTRTPVQAGGRGGADAGSESGPRRAWREGGGSGRSPGKRTRPQRRAAEISTHSASDSRAQRLQRGVQAVCIPGWARPPRFLFRASARSEPRGGAVPGRDARCSPPSSPGGAAPELPAGLRSQASSPAHSSGAGIREAG